MERGIEQYLMFFVIMFVVVADLLLKWLKRRFGKGGPAELEAPQEFELELDPEMEMEMEMEPEVLRRPDPPVYVPRAAAIAPRERHPVRGGQQGLRQPTARVAKRAVAPLLGSRADLRRAIVLREVLGPPKGLE